MSEYEIEMMEKMAAKKGIAAMFAKAMKRARKGGAKASRYAKGKAHQADQLVQRLGKSVGKGGRKVSRGKLRMGHLGTKKSKRLLGYGTLAAGGGAAGAGGYALSRKESGTTAVDRLNDMLFN